ncbi:MAG: WD40 repeat domain-containing protein [Bacteroidota bacterium]
MLRYALFSLLCGLPWLVSAQIAVPAEAELRLDPIWERVADVFGEAGSVESAEFSPDGKQIVSGTKFDNSVIMWRTSDGFEQWRAYHEAEIERVGFSADGKYVAACSEDFLTIVYEAATGKVVKKLPHTAGIDGLTWSVTAGRSLLATGEEDIKVEGEPRHGYLRIFEFPQGEQIKVLDVGETINEVAFSPDDAYLLAAHMDGAVDVFETTNWEKVASLRPEKDFGFVTAQWSPDGKYIAASGFGGDVFIWEFATRKLLRGEPINHSGRKIETVLFHPSGDYLATAGNDPYIRVFRMDDIRDARTVRVAYQVHANDQAEFMDFNADGSFLVSAHQDGVIRLWVWMSEDPDLNYNRHRKVTAEQRILEQKLRKQ